MPIIKVWDLHKSYGDTIALGGVSLDVEAGEVFGLLGPNGAGKTTLIGVLSTLVAPDRGTATVAGHDVASAGAEVRRVISLTGQFAAVDGVLTGRENLVLFARLRGLDRRAATTRAGELLQRFGLGDAADRRAATWSGGMRRRLDLAASLVTEPAVLLLDEPTTGLDPRSRAELWEVVRDLRRGGMTILLTTQYLEEADQLADRLAVLDHGQVVAAGTPAELKARSGGSTCVVTPVDAARLADVARALASLEAAALLGTSAASGGSGTRGLSIGPPRIDEATGSVLVPGATPALVAGAATALEAAGIGIAALALRTPTLDEVFLDLTGHRAAA